MEVNESTEEVNMVPIPISRRYYLSIVLVLPVGEQSANLTQLSICGGVLAIAGPRVVHTRFRKSPAIDLQL